MEFLKKPVTYLASVDKDENPLVRPGKGPFKSSATFDPEKKSWLYISKNLVFTDDEDIKNDVYLAHLFMKKKLFRFFEYSKFYVSTLAGNVVSTECEQNCQSPIP